MRERGTRFECLRMRPHDHIGWVFSGPAEFAELALPFLAEGAARGERLMFVANDPHPRVLCELADLVARDALQVASVAEIYGASGIVNAIRQFGTFAESLADALAAGYTGMRVAADNSPLVTDEEHLAAWIRWEVVADRFTAENPATGLCAFDRQKVDVDMLRHVATLHPITSAGGPAPRFRLFSDSGDLCVEGELSAFAVAQVRLALASLPSGTGVVIDLSAATPTGRAAMAALGQLADSGSSVIIKGEPDAVRALRYLAGQEGGRLVFLSVPA